MIRILFTILLIGDMSFYSYSQSEIIRGKVVDEEMGRPIGFSSIRSTVSLKEVFTNENGEFTISGVEVNDTLVISHIGYVTKLQPLKDILENPNITLIK